MESKQEIVSGLNDVFDLTTACIESLSDSDFRLQANPNKWSIAEEFDHLLISNVIVCTVMKRSPWIYKLRFGKPNRMLRTYQEVQDRYVQRISGEDRAVAPTPYLPKETSQLDKESMLSHWKSTQKKFEARIAHWDDKHLDKTLLPHPLLGKMMVREVLYFTHFHSMYHLKSMKSKLGLAE